MGSTERPPAGTDRTHAEPPQPRSGEQATGGGDDTTPDERWAAFAPPVPRAPGRLHRVAARFGRMAGHEWTLTVLGGLALAALMTWPALRHPRYTLPHDLGDPTLVAWILAWPGHALLTDPTELWHANAFYPDSRWSLAFTDSLLGYAPFALFGEGPMDAVLRYNIIYVLAFGLAFIGAYALVRQLGAGRAAALVVALAMLARGHGWSLRRGLRHRHIRPGWIVAGWLVAAWQITLGFGIGLVFGYVLASIVLVVAAIWLVRRAVPRWRPRVPVPLRRILGPNLVGGTVFAATTVLMALPYLTVVNLYPGAQRSLEAIHVFSPPAYGFLVAPDKSWLWGSLHEDVRAAPVSDGKEFWGAEMALLPGFALLGLAVAGLFISIWSVRARLLLAGGTLVAAALAMGTEFFDGMLYEPLYHWLPGWDALRTPGRLIIWVTLLLGVLAAGAVCALAERSRELALARGSPQPGGWLRLAMLVPAVLVLVEGFSTTPHPVVPPQPPALATVDGPVLVLPSNHATDMHVMLWTTDRFVPIVNGASGFAPPSLDQTQDATAGFPDQESVDHLRSLGVSTVVVLPDRVPGTPWESAADASGAGLGLVREEIDGSVIFHLDGG